MPRIGQMQTPPLWALIGLGSQGSRPGGPGRPRSPGVGLLLVVMVVWGRLSLQRAGGVGHTGPCGLGVGGCSLEQVWLRSMLPEASPGLGLAGLVVVTSDAAVCLGPGAAEEERMDAHRGPVVLINLFEVALGANEGVTT